MEQASTADAIGDENKTNRCKRDGRLCVRARVCMCVLGAIVWINVNLAFIAVWLDYTWIGLYCNLLFVCVLILIRILNPAKLIAFV